MRKCIAYIFLVTLFLVASFALNVYAADFVTLDSIADKKPGDAITISGTANFNEATIQVIAPNTTSIYLNVVAIESGSNFFSDVFDLPADAVEGTYTVKAGKGAAMTTTTFNVSNQSTAVSVTGVILDKNSLSLAAGNSGQLTATVAPANATNQRVTWSSNNTAAAAVDNMGKVTAKAAGTAVITVKTEDGGKTATCSVTVTGNGGSGSTGGGNSGTTVPAAPESPAVPEVPAASKVFKDVGIEYTWASEAIDTLASKGIIKGISADTFEPKSNIKRADFILLLVRALDLTAESDSNFADVSADAYYAQALAAAKKLGIAKGMEGNRFNPEDKISRQDLMTLIDRAMEVANKELAAGTDADIAAFVDKSSIASYAVQSISTLVKNGIVTGDGTNINPLGNATRAETAVLIYRIYNK